MTTGEPQLGFACLWGRDPSATWSGTPWALRTALAEQMPVADVGPEPSFATRAALKAISLRRHDGRWVTPWRWSRAWRAVAHADVRRRLRRTRAEALLQIGDFGRFDVPYFLYQDLNYDVLDAHLDGDTDAVPGFEGLSVATIERRRERQRAIYDGAAGVFAMSAWFADVLVRQSGVAPEKVHVALAGIHARPPDRRPQPRAAAQRRSLLFVGRDFRRKGGPLVVAATDALRRQGTPVTLTIAGPAAWPLSTPPPDWVRFVGDVPTSEVSELLLSTDLLVLPSHFEAFGIAFAEALAHGVPCIGRRAFAMAELVEDGRSGALIDSDDPDELAATIERVLRDDDVHRHCAEQAASVAARYSWEDVARRVAAVIRGAM